MTMMQCWKGFKTSEVEDNSHNLQGVRLALWQGGDGVWRVACSIGKDVWFAHADEVSRGSRNGVPAHSNRRFVTGGDDEVIWFVGEGAGAWLKKQRINSTIAWSFETYALKLYRKCAEKRAESNVGNGSKMRCNYLRNTLKKSWKFED